MNITYSWKITSLKVKDIENKPNSVCQTYWDKIGVTDDGVEGVFHGATPFTVDPTDQSGPFIPFEELTEDDVLQWIKTVVVGEYENHVNTKILNQILLKQNSVREIEAINLPWAATPVENTPIS